MLEGVCLKQDSVRNSPQWRQRRHCSCRILSATRITNWSSIGLLHSEQIWIMSGIFRPQSRDP